MTDAPRRTVALYADKEPSGYALGLIYQDGEEVVHVGEPSFHRLCAEVLSKAGWEVKGPAGR